MIYKAFDKQIEFHQSNARIRAALAGKRGGKTECGAIEAIIYTENQKGWDHNQIDPYAGAIIAPTTDMLRRLSLKKFLAYAKPFNPQFHQTFNEVTWHNGSVIYGISGDKPARLEGLKLNWIWIDEVFQCSEQLFLECRARVADQQGDIWLTGSLGVQYQNPKRHWTYKYLKENKPDTVDVFEWATSDNPYFPKDELADLKDTLDPRTFRQMFTIDWNTPSSALVYDNFSELNYVKGFVIDPSRHEVSVSIDWGWNHELACLFIAYDIQRDTVTVFDEIISSRMTLDQLYARIMAKQYPISNWFCDIAGNQEREQTGKSNVQWFREKGIQMRYRQTAVNFGVALVRTYIKTGSGLIKLYIDELRCPKTIDGMLNYSYPTKDGQIVNENPLKVADDACFEAGTKVHCLNGQKNIEDITPGEYVITRNGPKRVLSVSCRLGRIEEFNIKNRVIRATRSHPVFVTGRGFVAISDLTEYDKANTVEYQCEKQLYTKAENTHDGQKQGNHHIEIITTTHVLDIFIGKYGKMCTGLLEKVRTYITRTVMHPIIVFLIWKQYRDQITQEFTGKKVKKLGSNHLEKTWIWPEFLHQFGTDQKKDTSFIKNLGSYLGLIAKRKLEYARFVLKLIKYSSASSLNFAQITANLHGDELAVKMTNRVTVLFAGMDLQHQNTLSREHAQKHAGQILQKQLKPVYNLNVEDVHEYFANGILVSNCDSLRYYFVNRLDKAIQQTEVKQFNRWGEWKF